VPKATIWRSNSRRDQGTVCPLPRPSPNDQDLVGSVVERCDSSADVTAGRTKDVRLQLYGVRLPYEARKPKTGAQDVPNYMVCEREMPKAVAGSRIGCKRPARTIGRVRCNSRNDLRRCQKERHDNIECRLNVSPYDYCCCSSARCSLGRPETASTRRGVSSQ
jgi:hypothetical protein